MTPEQQLQWQERTATAVSGASVLSQLSAREVARHALKELFVLTQGDYQKSLSVIQKIGDFSVRRRLLEMFRRGFVDASENFKSDIFFKRGQFKDPKFADAFDNDLLELRRQSAGSEEKLQALISHYPLWVQRQIRLRLGSRAFARKRRIRQAGTVFNAPGMVSNHFINLLALIIFIGLLIIAFD